MLTKADIRLVRSLADKRARTDEGLFVAEGGKLIGELRASTLRIRRIYALDGVFAGEDVTTVSPKEMERLSLLKTPSDSLALVEIPRRRLDPAKLRRSLVLALDDVQNPGNLGTIVRLADWFGIGDVVTRKLFIPPYPAERHATESLNVAMATGIVCAEFRRQASAGQ